MSEVKSDIPVGGEVSVLFVKLGTHPELSTIAREVTKLTPGIRVIGIGTDETTPSDIGEMIAHERDVTLGAFDAWWNQQLFVDPELYLKVVNREGQLLRMAERVARHDVYEVRLPGFPVAKFSYDVDGSMQLLLRQLAFWDWILHKHNVKGVVFQNIPHNFWDATLYAVVEARGIPTLCFHEVWPFMKSVYIYEHPLSMGDLSHGKKLLTEASHRYGMIPDSLGRRDRMWKQVSVGEAVRSRQVGSGSTMGVWSRIRSLFRRPGQVSGKAVRAIRRRRQLRETSRDYEAAVTALRFPERFVFMEMQRSANMTTLVKGYMYGDPREMVAHVAGSLPAGYTLVVRESSRSGSSRGARREKFWIQISSIPHVQVISSEVDTKEILAAASGMIELGYSSLALEGINRGLPVVVLGLTHLQGAPNAFIVNRPSELRMVMGRALNKTPLRQLHQEELEAGLRAWADETMHSTLEGRLSSHRDKSDESDPAYGTRIVGNTARVVAAWCELRVRNLSQSTSKTP